MEQKLESQNGNRQAAGAKPITQMNTPAIKSAIPPIKLPEVKPTTAPTPKGPPSRPSPTERIESLMMGKYFHYIFRSGTRFKSGRVEAILGDHYFAVRFFRDGKLERRSQIVRFYDSPSIEEMTGYWLYDTEADMRESEPALEEELRIRGLERAEEANQILHPE